MITLNNFTIKPTIFPDKTSQVWKLPENLIESHNKIIWNFEDESEFIHIAQLCNLIGGKHVHLNIPYFPYARQDKEISNDNTFALRTFCLLLDSLQLNYIKTFDLHSNVAKQILKTPLIVDSAEAKILDVIDTLLPEVIVYPDLGAQTRYGNITPKHLSACFTKVRNQQTGEILGLTTTDNTVFRFQDTKILIVDDICDGGATFINIAKYIKNVNNSAKINLYTSHGIYSKGIEVLRANGIDRIFNRNGEI